MSGASLNYLNVLENALDYNMGHQIQGRCLIFDHEHFDDPKENPQRQGTKVDVQRLKSFFGDKLGFEVTPHHDLSKKQLIKVTQNMADQDFTEYNCFVCCILTHGTETHLNAHDGKYKLEQIISFFRAERCQTLAGKPKLFFIQACQGIQEDPGHDLRLICGGNQTINSLSATNAVSTDEELTNVDSSSVPSIVTVRIPICADILVAYSTVPKHYSYRDTITGSWFFQVLTEVLEEHFEEYDLLTILTITKRRIALEKEFQNKKQIPWITDTLTRRVIFKKLTQNQTS